MACSSVCLYLVSTSNLFEFLLDGPITLFDSLSETNHRRFHFRLFDFGLVSVSFFRYTTKKIPEMGNKMLEMENWIQKLEKYNLKVLKQMRQSKQDWGEHKTLYKWKIDVHSWFHWLVGIGLREGVAFYFLFLFLAFLPATVYIVCTLLHLFWHFLIQISFTDKKKRFST